MMESVVPVDVVALLGGFTPFMAELAAEKAALGVDAASAAFDADLDAIYAAGPALRGGGGALVTIGQRALVVVNALGNGSALSRREGCSDSTRVHPPEHVWADQ